MATEREPRDLSEEIAWIQERDLEDHPPEEVEGDGDVAYLRDIKPPLIVPPGIGWRH